MLGLMLLSVVGWLANPHLQPFEQLTVQQMQMMQVTTQKQLLLQLDQ
jgi:hypothetical protein